MTTAEPAPKTAARRWRRWLLPALIVTVAVGAAVYIFIPVHPLNWAERHDWDPTPVRETDLKSTFGKGWRNLSFTLSLDEEAAVNECVTLAQRNNSMLNGKTRFAEPEVRQQLEAILRRHPNFFYAEYLLAMWHRNDGSAEEAERYQRLAIAHAPVVLIQSYVSAYGPPLANMDVGRIEIECNRVQNGNLNPSLRLVFPGCETDEHGRVYLPVFDTVYRLSSISYPEGYELVVPSLGWFESRKVGLLPTAVAHHKPTTRPAE
jgi:hypothetical protein